ncbi:MAG: hypothetical protein ACJA2W_001279 [Planctomycetota bacterium]|jgi:hypothetical protein
MPAYRWIVRTFVVSWMLLVEASGLRAATQEGALLKNGSFEESAEGKPVWWSYPGSLAAAGATLSLDTVEPLDGQQSARLDSTGVGDARRFGMLNQSLEAASYRGKRVRFRAAVRTAERGTGGKAQLWLRVDSGKDGGETSISAFDNMGDRPIEAGDWQHYEIVADVGEDAVRMTIGVIALRSALHHSLLAPLQPSVTLLVAASIRRPLVILRELQQRRAGCPHVECAQRSWLGGRGGFFWWQWRHHLRLREAVGLLRPGLRRRRAVDGD